VTGSHLDPAKTAHSLCVGPVTIPSGPWEDSSSPGIGPADAAATFRAALWPPGRYSSIRAAMRAAGASVRPAA
jgi:hypothetical protein